MEIKYHTNALVKQGVDLPLHTKQNKIMPIWNSEWRNLNPTKMATNQITGSSTTWLPVVGLTDN